MLHKIGFKKRMPILEEFNLRDNFDLIKEVLKIWVSWKYELRYDNYIFNSNLNIGKLPKFFKH